MTPSGEVIDAERCRERIAYWRKIAAHGDWLDTAGRRIALWERRLRAVERLAGVQTKEAPR